MTLTREEHMFVIMLMINLIVAAVYLFCGLFIAVPIQKKKNEEALYLCDDRKTYVIRFVIMLLCPVVAPVFFFITHLLYLTIFRFQVNLEDVVFDKSRVKTQVKANEELERNVIPVEDALAVSDEKSMRTAMMNIIKGDLEESLSSISLALNSEDSESAHYAASILSSKLNDIRIEVHKFYQQMKQEDSEHTEYEEALLAYMNSFLKQKIFMDLEQYQFVRMMEEAAEQLFQKNASKLKPEWYESLCLQLLENREFESVDKWCTRMEEQYPEELCSYTCRLKLYFTEKNKEAFYQTLDALKNSDVVIDNETLEMIRIFS